MLKKIILCLRDSYKDALIHTKELASFAEEMEKHGTIAAIENAGDTVSQDALYISDDADMLSFLQNRGCYTVALYHEGSSGLLGGTQYALEGLKDADWEYLYKVYQRFAHIPWDITQTKRCSIREMGEEDVDALYKLYEDPQITRFTEGLFEHKEQEKQYIRDYIKNVYEYYGFGTWLIHRKEDGQLIGRAGFNYRPGFEEVELGFVIGVPYQKNGYAYEVCRHLLDLGKNAYEFDKVQALVKAENEASIRLLTGLGFSCVEKTNQKGEEYMRYVRSL